MFRFKNTLEPIVVNVSMNHDAYVTEPWIRLLVFEMRVLFNHVIKTGFGCYIDSEPLLLFFLSRTQNKTLCHQVFERLFNYSS